MTTGTANERVEFSRPSDIPGIEIMLVENCARRWRAFHETYTVCTALAGAGAEWIYRNKIYNSTSGELMLLEPGEVHANTRITSVANFRVLLIDPSLVDKAAR